MPEQNNNTSAQQGGGDTSGSSKQPRNQPPLKSPLQKKNERSKSGRRRAQMASRRNAETAEKMINRFGVNDAASNSQQPRRANVVKDSGKLRVIGLGGMDGGGSKNMIVIEYGNDAIITDVGIDLGVDLPGINFAIPDVSYLESIKHKIRGYVFTHGHLDHIGAAPFVVPKYPAPVFGSRFTLAMVERIFENSPATPDNFELKTVVMNQDNHERLKVGPFIIELVRVTHSIPGSTAVVIDTPVGRLVNSGDFKIDPEPLDHQPTDIARLNELGKDGVLLLMSESTSTLKLGRTPTEQTLQPTFDELIKFAPGRVFIAMFSTNINRIQLIINAAVKHGRQVSFDGRSMLANLEVAVRSGFVKIPQGTVVAMNQTANIPDDKLVVITTGAQGEPNSALRRMTTGDHNHVKLKAQDTVILSSTPIPTTGNDGLIEHMVDDALRRGVHVYQHPTHEVDKIGPLHVSGHGGQEEYAELIEMLKPKFFVPIYGSYSSKSYHIELAVEAGLVDRKDTLNVENGDVIEFSEDSMKLGEKVIAGSTLVDNTGELVPNIVIKDRLLMAQDGILTVILTLKKGSGQLMTSPDIITRGFIYIKDSEELMNELRKEARFMAMRRFKNMKLDDFKQELRDHIQHIVFQRTERSPIVISVVNVIGNDGRPVNPSNGKPRQPIPKPSADHES